MTALDDIVKNLQGVGGTIVSTGGNIASGISGGISSLSTSLPTINLPTVNLPNINLPNVSLPTLPTNIQLPQMQLPTINLPKLPTNIQMPQIQLPTIDASRINIPQTLQTAIQLPISSMAVPGSLAIGAATTLAAPAIREVITGTKLFPAGAACTTCPSTEELLIANKIDPSKYTLTPLPTVTHQPTQVVLPQPTRQQLIRASETQPSIITIPGPSTEGVDTRINQQPSGDWVGDRFSDVYTGMTNKMYDFLGISGNANDKDISGQVSRVMFSPITNAVSEAGLITKNIINTVQVTLKPRSTELYKQQQIAVKDVDALVAQQNTLWNAAKKDGYVKMVNGVETFVIPQGDTIAQQRYDEISKIASDAKIKSTAALELGKAYESEVKEEEKRSVGGLYERAEAYVGEKYTKPVFPTMYAPGEYLLKTIADPTDFGKNLEKTTGLLPSEHLKATLGGGLKKTVTVREGDQLKTTTTEYGMDLNKTLFDIPKTFGARGIDTLFGDTYLARAAKKAGGFISSQKGMMSLTPLGVLSPGLSAAGAVGTIGNVPYSLELAATKAAFESPRDRPIMTTAMFALPYAIEGLELGGAATVAGMATRGGVLGTAGRALSSPLAKDVWSMGKTVVGVGYAADLPQRITGYGIIGGDLSKGELLKYTPIPGVDTSNIAIGERLGRVVGSELIPMAAGAGTLQMIKNPQLVPDIIKRTWIDLNYRPTGGSSRTFGEYFRDVGRSARDTVTNRVWRYRYGVTTEPHGAYTGTPVDVTPEPVVPTGGGASSGNPFSSYFRNVQQSARTSITNLGRTVRGTSGQPTSLSLVTSSSRGVTPTGIQTRIISSGGVTPDVQPSVTHGELTLYRPAQTSVSTVRRVVTDTRGVPIRSSGGGFLYTEEPVTTSADQMRWSNVMSSGIQGREAQVAVKGRGGTQTPVSVMGQETSMTVNTMRLPDERFVDTSGREFFAERTHTQLVEYNPRTNMATVTHQIVSTPTQYRGTDISNIPLSTPKTGVTTTGERVTIQERVLNGRVVQRITTWIETGQATIKPPDITTQRDVRGLAGAINEMSYSESEVLRGNEPFFGQQYTPQGVSVRADRVTTPGVTFEEVLPMRNGVSTQPVASLRIPVDTTTKALVPFKQARTTPRIFRIGEEQPKSVFGFQPSKETFIFDALGESRTYPLGKAVEFPTNYGAVLRESWVNPSTNRIYTPTADGRSVIIRDATNGQYIGTYKFGVTDTIDTVFERMLIDPMSISPEEFEIVGSLYGARTSGGGNTRPFAPELTIHNRRTSTKPRRSTTKISGASTISVEKQTGGQSISEKQSAKAKEFLKKTTDFMQSSLKNKPIDTTASEEERALISQLTKDYNKLDTTALRNLNRNLNNDIIIRYSGGSPTPENQKIINTNQIAISVIERIINAREPRRSVVFTQSEHRAIEKLSKEYDKYSTSTLNNIGFRLQRDIIDTSTSPSITDVDKSAMSSMVLVLSAINGILTRRSSVNNPFSIPEDAFDYIAPSKMSQRGDEYSYGSAMMPRTGESSLSPDSSQKKQSPFDISFKNTGNIFIESSKPYQKPSNEVTPVFIPNVGVVEVQSPDTSVTPIVIRSPIDESLIDTTQTTDQAQLVDTTYKPPGGKDEYTTTRPPEYTWLNPPEQITVTTPEVPPYTPTTPYVPTTPDIPVETPPTVPFLIPPGGGSSGAPSGGGVGYYGFEEFTPVRTPADIVAALMGYGRSRKKSTKKKKNLKRGISISLEELLGIAPKTTTPIGVAPTTTSYAFSTNTPVESAIDRAMSTFLSAGKNPKLVPRKQTYNKARKATTSKKPLRLKKPKVTKTTKRRKSTPKRARSTTAHQRGMITPSNKYLKASGKRTSKWLGV